MTEKERIYEEIQIRIRERAKLNDEIVKLWDKYYSLNKKKDEQQ